MILETAQILCTVHWETGGEAHYKSTHKNHPSSKWARESIQNYNWLCQLGLALCNEYSLRYGKRHKSQDIIEWARKNKPALADSQFTPPPQCMPDECKIADDTIAAYRKYYKEKKSHIAVWKTKIPKWFE